MSYSRNKYRCLLKSNNQNVIVCDDNNIKKPIPQPQIGPYFGYYPGPYYPGIGSYGPYGPYYPGPYGPYGPYPYSQKKEQEKQIPKSRNVGNENIQNHCEYESSSSSSSDSERYCGRYRYRRYVVAPEGVEGISSERVFDEENQKPYPIPKPKPPKEPPTDISNNTPKDKKQFAKPFAKLLTKLTKPEEAVESNDLGISLGENEINIQNQNEKNEIQNEKKIYLKV